MPSKRLGCHIHISACNHTSLFHIKGLEHLNVDVVTRQLLNHFTLVLAEGIQNIIALSDAQLVSRTIRELHHVLILHVASSCKGLARGASRDSIDGLDCYKVEVLRSQFLSVKSIVACVFIDLAWYQPLLRISETAPVLPLLLCRGT